MTQSDCESIAGAQPLIRLVCWLVLYAAWLPPGSFNHSWPRAEPAVCPSPLPPPLTTLEQCTASWLTQIDRNKTSLIKSHTHVWAHALTRKWVNCAGLMAAFLTAFKCDRNEAGTLRARESASGFVGTSSVLWMNQIWCVIFYRWLIVKKKWK